MKYKLFTNCFLVKKSPSGVIEQVCLGMKKRGFGVGLWNGAGGKPNENELIFDAAKREVEEEFQVTVKDIVKCGEFNFELKLEEVNATMHTFLVSEWDGEPIETEEMNPKWFEINNVPYDQMWKSDREFLPMIFEGKKVKGHYVFDKEGGDVLEGKIEEVRDF